jgi:outer membrane receptor protein involved in Fe transport
MIHQSKQVRLRRHALAAAVALALAGGAAQAQLSTATVKGQISGGAAGTVVTAVNKANGNTYRTTALADGSYVLPGLAPGEYEIRVAGGATETVTLQVGQTASLDLALAGAQQITIVGTAQRRDVKTSEVGTSVSRRLIEALPQQTNNFLSSADLAPGVAFSSDGGGNTRIQAGAQNFDHVNVYIDGVGQKNNILRGGVTGQDTSRGNPFPQSAIAEYKVLTQNYKAEFDQVSSAAITAITRSGTNEFHGGAYVDRTGTSWRAMTSFEKEREAQGVELPPSKKYEYGFDFGGPIVQDRLHFFVAYDGKNIQDSRQVVAQNLNRFPDTSVGILPRLSAAQGAQVDEFREHLLFGRIDSQFNDNNRLTGTFKLRRESDRLPEDRLLSMPGNDKDRKNDETRLDLTHEYTNGSWLNELRVGYENALWNPRSASTEPFVKYKFSSALPPRWDQSQDVLFEGGSPDAQRREQSGTYLRNDLTYTGLARHVLKGGVQVKAMKYDLGGTSRSVPIVEVTIDTVTGLPYFDGTHCTGTNFTSSASGEQTTECRLQAAIAPAAVNFGNKQYGLYFQDDWSLTKQLELNLGVRWDYEDNMLNNDYVTPADRVTALRALDGRTVDGPGGPIVAPAGQTYAQSLARGGINIDDYIATGSRKAFKRAFAPRVGASYDITGDRSTVLFGGWGRSYDRTMANNALDELQKNAQPAGEIWLIRNDFKMPYADQASFGVRQAVGAWNAEVALSRVEAKNQFVWFHGNRDPNGGFGNQNPIDPLWGGPAGYGSLVLGDFVGETRTDSLFVKFEKPYTPASGWQVNVAYTFSDAQTTARNWDNDIFDWTYLRGTERGFHRSRLVDRHRVVAAGIVDLPWGLNLGAKAIWASGMPRQLTDCSRGFPTSTTPGQCVYVEGDTPSFRQFDVSLAKAFTFGAHKLALRADVLNLFNSANYGGFDDWVGGPGTANAYGGDNPNLGKPNAIRGDPRTFRLRVSYAF